MYAPALSLIRSAPTSAATVVVWNVLLNAVLVPGSEGSRGRQPGGGQQHAAAVRRAYEIWMEMKRRGVIPTCRSYGTFLTGVAKRAKRAASEVEHRSSSPGHHHRALEGWNAELRAKVETVHKQWRMHCERVLERAERQGGPSSEQGQDDGRHDSIESLSPLPTNQYLSFLSASLTLSLATATTSTSTGAAPMILDHLVRTFEAIPDPDVDPRLGRTTVSYQVVLSALKTVLQQKYTAAGAVSPEPAQTADTVDDGFEVVSLGRPSQVGSETAFPTAHQILDRALAMWDHLVLHPPSPELPSPGSSSSFSVAVTPATSAPLPPILPTALLSLYLSTPSSATSILPPGTHARFLAIPQLAFGFVPPFRAADLEPPHPDGLVVPLCSPGATLDRAAFGAALRTARRAAVAAGAESSTRWTRAWWDQVRDYPERFGLERGGLGEGDGGLEGGVGQVRLMDREAAQEVMKAAGRAGDVESIEGEPLFPFCGRPCFVPLPLTYSLPPSLPRAQN